MEELRNSVLRQLRGWGNDPEWINQVDQELLEETGGSFQELLHDAWLDYQLYHNNREEWAREGFDQGIDEELIQTQGVTRALSNLQSALDKIRSQPRSTPI